MAESSSLYIYNTLTKRKECFVPRKPGQVKLFTCGPSVYRDQHVGNYRTFLFEDVLQRYLEYLGLKVERGMNFTDIEDKAVAESKNTGNALPELTQAVIDRFYTNVEMLQIVVPQAGITRATTVIPQAVQLVKRLLERGHAYRHEDGNIYFDPLSYSGFGEVFGLDMSKWPTRRRRFARDTYEGRRWNRGDFVLWHGRDGADAYSWDTELGPGRPAWNVQDPAVILAGLGSEIDIHCGGIDNVYRHHDYNRAVMEAAFGTEFCPYWVHGEHLIVDGRKMSKSRGNVLYPEQLLNKGHTPAALRLSLVYEPYRQQLNLNEEYLQRTGKRVHRLQAAAERLLRPVDPAEPNGLTTSDHDSPAGAGGAAGARVAEWEAHRSNRMIEELPHLFRLNMDNDLGLGKAVEDIRALLEHIGRRAERTGLSAKQASRIREHLMGINSVLRILHIP